MKRRTFIAGLGSAAAWPAVAMAQQPGMPVIGFLGFGSPDTDSRRIAAFRRGLSETGHVEGRNVAIEYRWAGGDNNRLPALADELVHRQVAVIAPITQAGGIAAKAATQTTPVVFIVGNDPVALGLVDSLNHPGGNATGVHILNSEMMAKRLQLLHEVVPAATSIAYFIDPTNRGNAPELRELQDAERVLSLRLLPLNASNQTGIEAAFSLLVQQRAGGLLVPGDPIFLSQRDQIVALAAQHAVPVIYPYNEYMTAGGLMSYGTDLFDATRLAGVYTGRILRGEKPGDLPVQQSTKVELVINMKTAKAVGLTIPLPLLGRADEVIE